MAEIRTGHILSNHITPESFKSLQDQARTFREQLNYIHSNLDCTIKKVELQPNTKRAWLNWANIQSAALLQSPSDLSKSPSADQKLNAKEEATTTSNLLCDDQSFVDVKTIFCKVEGKIKAGQPFNLSPPSFPSSLDQHYLHSPAMTHNFQSTNHHQTTLILDGKWYGLLWFAMQNYQLVIHEILWASTAPLDAIFQTLRLQCQLLTPESIV